MERIAWLEPVDPNHAPRAGSIDPTMKRAAKYMIPMKALGVEEVPVGQWRCEIKFDGYRAVAVINNGRVELWSRNYKPLGPDYPDVVKALAGIKCRNAVLDGEIVALDSAGRSRFQLLQGRDLGERPRIVYYLFDLMHLEGVDLTAEPLEARQTILAKLLKNPKTPLQLSPWFDLAPAELMKAARAQGLEGIIVKRPGSLYESDRRSGAWLKCKVHGEQEFVIGGFTLPQRSRPFFGAILIGYYQGGKFLYAGKVGTGFNYKLLESLHAQFLRRKRVNCPFQNLPMERRSRFGSGMTRAEMRKVTWVRPELVAQIKFAEWTHDGVLRQPVFLGLRKDKPAKAVRREAGPA
ncbi:MAG: ATP-dependent ligase [Verrucomicrobia bacterium]|nr:ATP-dependent ligase [Verrucomicrobiota bacterium]